VGGRLSRRRSLLDGRLRRATNVELTLDRSPLNPVLGLFGSLCALRCRPGLFDLSQLGDACRLGCLLRRERRGLRFLNRQCFSGCLGGGGRLFFGRCLNIGCASPTAHGRFGSAWRRGGWRGFDDGRPTAPRGGRWRALLLGSRALLAFPTRPNPGYLIVREQTQMTANRDIHLPKQSDDLIGGNPEFASHVMNAKFAQTSSSRALMSPTASIS
jgi:hypothetical protein